MNIENLTAKVRARNAVNKLAAELAPAAQAMIAQFEGVKVQLASGTGHTAKLNKAIGALNLPNHGPRSTSVWITSSNYSISMRLQVDVITPAGRSFRGEATVYLADLNNGVVTRLREVHAPRRTDYSVDAVLTARAKVRIAREDLQAAESKLAGFGEYDN